MKIRVGKKVYSTKESVIVLEFENGDLAQIKKAPDKSKKFIMFPMDKYTAEQALEISKKMENHKSVFKTLLLKLLFKITGGKKHAVQKERC